jgi:hypothetical protein
MELEGARDSGSESDQDLTKQKQTKQERLSREKGKETDMEYSKEPGGATGIISKKSELKVKVHATWTGTDLKTTDTASATAKKKLQKSESKERR